MMHWIKNGPEVKKPCGDCLIRTKDGFTDIAQWSHDPDCLIWSNTQNVYCDDEVVHFAVIASPLSRSRRMIDPNLLREITEKVRGIAYDQNDGNGVTAVLPSEVFAVCDQLLRILDAFDAMERARWTFSRWTRFTDNSVYWTVAERSKIVAEGPSPLAALLAAAETLKGANDENG